MLAVISPSYCMGLQLYTLDCSVVVVVVFLDVHIYRFCLGGFLLFFALCAMACLHAAVAKTILKLASIK